MRICRDIMRAQILHAHAHLHFTSSSSIKLSTAPRIPQSAHDRCGVHEAAVLVLTRVPLLHRSHCVWDTSKIYQDSTRVPHRRSASSWSGKSLRFEGTLLLLDAFWNEDGSLQTGVQAAGLCSTLVAFALGGGDGCSLGALWQTKKRNQTMFL